MTLSDTPGGYLRTMDLLSALSLAADMALGLSVGHGVRATYIGMRIAEELGVEPGQRVDLFYAELLMDAGCTAWASQMAAAILGDEIEARRELFFFSDAADPRDILKWLARYMASGERLDSRIKRSVSFAVHGKEFMVEGLRNTAETAARMAGRLDRSQGVQEALRFVFEQWNGAGPYERRGGSIPLVSRIVYATIFLEVFHQLGGRETATTLARTRRGKSLDPDVVDAFVHLASNEDFWLGLESESIWNSVRNMEPDSPYRYFSADRLDLAAQAFADFADLKSFYSAGHSRRVAALAERTAIALALPTDAITTVRRAALLHDIGMVAVPSFVLHKPQDRLTAAEWESLRLHPYHAERILSRVPAFAAVNPIIAAHHERPDGQGYFHGLGADRIPVGARIITAADVFDELTHARPEGAAMDPGAAVDAMRLEVGTRFFPEVIAALTNALDMPTTAAGSSHGSVQAPQPRQQQPHWPNGLTAREVDVLRALATGASRRAMAERLTVSEHTVRHHLEHIYSKIDVSTRVEATLFALEHDILA